MQSDMEVSPSHIIFIFAFANMQLVENFLFRHDLTGKHDTETEQRLVSDTSAMVIRNKDDQVAMLDSAAGQFLQQRTYQGLDVRVGENAPSILEQGRNGIARGYQDDR